MSKTTNTPPIVTTTTTTTTTTTPSSFLPTSSSSSSSSSPSSSPSSVDPCLLARQEQYRGKIIDNPPWNNIPICPYSYSYTNNNNNNNNNNNEDNNNNNNNNNILKNELRLEPSQIRFLKKIEERTWLMRDLIIYFKSHCFTTSYPYFISETLQGYSCRAFKIDIRHEKNSALLEQLMDKEHWNIIRRRVEGIFDKLPPVCFVKISLQFLVRHYRSIQTIPIPECILREMHILKKLSKKEQSASNICRYVTHWETPGEWGEYYLATEYCDCRWQNSRIYKSMNLFQYVTFILYPKNMNPIAQFLPVYQKYGNRFHPSTQLESRYERFCVIQRIFRRLVQIVHWLHTEQIAHLDIALENLMIAGGIIKDPLIKLIDFGVAQDFSKNLDPNHYDLRVGRREYMAPEVEKISKSGYNAYAADIWTLGVCLWILIFKEQPFISRMEKVKLVKENSTYLLDTMRQDGLLPMVTQEAFDVLFKIFRPSQSRITAKELISHPFCAPNTNTAVNTAPENERKEP